MNLLVVGVSHHTAPVELLERLSIPTDDTRSVLAALVAQPFVNEAVVRAAPAVVGSAVVGAPRAR